MFFTLKYFGTGSIWFILCHILILRLDKMNHQIIIVTSSYGADYINQIGGQHYIIPTIKAAGADGVEIRRELLSSSELTQLPKLAQQISAHHLICFYSVPFHLFIAGGKLNPQLVDYLQEAEQLNAKLIKFSLGYFQLEQSDLLELTHILKRYPNIQLVVENDQTECGVIEPFDVFFQQVQRLSIPVKMTFDTGNWLCLDIDPVEAAKRLGQHVAYIHVKAGKLIAKGKIDAMPPVDGDFWMSLINDLLPHNAFRGIEFAIVGQDLGTVSLGFVKLLRN